MNKHSVSTQAAFQHDCDTCVFLGHTLGSDLYFCAVGKTVIARWSSDGPDYTSGMALAKFDVRLAAAVGLAFENCLLADH